MCHKDSLYRACHYTEALPFKSNKCSTYIFPSFFLFITVFLYSLSDVTLHAYMNQPTVGQLIWINCIERLSIDSLSHLCRNVAMRVMNMKLMTKMEFDYFLVTVPPMCTHRMIILMAVAIKSSSR